MAIAHVQSVTGSNGLAQTFGVTYGVTPTNGNLLIAALFHDETLQDQSTVTSAGWTRAATFDASTLTPDGRISVYARLAGVSEPTAVNFDLGEVNRRAHGYALEYSGFIESIPDADGGSKAVAESSANVNSLQVSTSLSLRVNALGIAIGGAFNSSGGTPSWDSGLTTQITNSANFRHTGLGWIEGANTLQPTLSWVSNRPAGVMYVEIAATLADELKGSPILVI